MKMTGMKKAGMKKAGLKKAVCCVLFICLLPAAVGCRQNGQETSQEETQEQTKVQLPSATGTQEQTKEQPSSTAGTQDTLETEMWEANRVFSENTMPSLGAAPQAIPETVLEGKRKDLQIYEADINRDGTKEYVITYLPQDSDAVHNVVIYDAQTNQETNVLAVSQNKITFTENQKKQMRPIIEQWYANDFALSRGISQENFLDYHITTLSCYPVNYEEQDMLHVSYRIEEQSANILMRGDKIELLLAWDGKEYAVHKYWYVSQYKSISGMGS